MRFAPLLLAFATSLAFAADEDPIENPRLPRLWHVQSRTKIRAEQVAAIAKKLGVEMTSLENDVIDAGGVRLQVNIARCPDEKTAEALRNRFVEVHGGHWRSAVRRGADVAEIVCDNVAVTWKARDLVGWTRGYKYEYAATMAVAPLDRCDCTRWNALFNLLSKSSDPNTKPAPIEEEATAFTFGGRLVVRSDGEPTATPVPTSTLRKGDVVELSFAPLPRKFGVPLATVSVGGTIVPFEPRPAPKDVSAWTSANDAWPTKSPAVQKALVAALGDKPRAGADATARRRVEDLVAWIHANVHYGGGDVGSRYGVEKVVAQGFGHCWDQSDVFVTLCRAAGIPTRQVGGWLTGGEGHVWAEVVVEEGLLAVDPGTTWLGVSADYVPLWVSEDGRIPFVYWDAPLIEGPFAELK